MAEAGKWPASKKEHAQRFLNSWWHEELKNSTKIHLIHYRSLAIQMPKKFHRLGVQELEYIYRISDAAILSPEILHHSIG